jgi:hypothetical protein
MKHYSGKFVVRIDPKLHQDLHRRARAGGISLNQLIIQNLAPTLPPPHKQIVDAIVSAYEPEAILLFGSTARGQARTDSDIDLLIVLPEAIQIRRSLYQTWEKTIAPKFAQHSPQFVNPPRQTSNHSGLWLEVALDGQVLFGLEKISVTLAKIKETIASGLYQRKWSHGHPYWIRQE